MERGRPKKDLDEFDKELIGIKLSFNQIKHILYKFKDHQPSSIEGQVSIKMIAGLRKYLLKRAKEGKLPQEIVDAYITTEPEGKEND